MLVEFNTATEAGPFVIDERGVKITLSPSKRKKVKKISILVEGQFSLNNSAFVHEKLTEGIAAYDTIDILLKNIQQIDLTAIQALYYIKNTTENKIKAITIDAELSKEDRSVIFNSGLMELLTRTKLTD